MMLVGHFIHRSRHGLCGYCGVRLHEPPLRQYMDFVPDDVPDAPTAPGDMLHHLCMKEMSYHFFVQLYHNFTDDEFLQHDAGWQLFRDVLERCIEEVDTMIANKSALRSSRFSSTVVKFPER